MARSSFLFTFRCLPLLKRWSSKTSNGEYCDSEYILIEFCRLSWLSTFFFKHNCAQLSFQNIELTLQLHETKCGEWWSASAFYLHRELSNRTVSKVSDRYFWSEAFEASSDGSEKSSWNGKLLNNLIKFDTKLHSLWNHLFYNQMFVQVFNLIRFWFSAASLLRRTSRLLFEVHF